MANENLNENIAWEDMPPQTKVKSVVEQFSPPIPEIPTKPEDIGAQPELSNQQLQNIDDVPNKADKVQGAANGNLAGLDSHGNLTDSGKKPSDFASSTDLATVATGLQATNSVVSSIASTTQSTAAGLDLLSTEVNIVKSKIPPAASSSNKLVDQNTLDTGLAEKQPNLSQQQLDDIADIPNKASVDYVDTAVATSTANFLGTYDYATDLGFAPPATSADVDNDAIAVALPSHVEGTPTNNDYVFVQVDYTATTSADEFRRFKYNATDAEWLYEYTLNSASFTQEQWAAINSGLTGIVPPSPNATPGQAASAKETGEELNLKLSRDEAEEGYTLWTVLREGADVTGQVQQPLWDSSESAWATQRACIAGDASMQPYLESPQGSLEIEWAATYYDEQSESDSDALYKATRTLLRPTKTSQLENDGAPGGNSPYATVAQLPSVPAASTATPQMDGTGSAGTSNTFSKGDHVHPTDTTRAPLNSPSFTGTPEAPTPTTGDNSTKVATTAFVQTAISAADPTNKFNSDSVAPAFTAKEYVVGEICTYNGVRYKCKSAYTADGNTKPDSDSTHWDTENIQTAIDNIDVSSQVAGKLNSDSAAPAFDSTKTYLPGDYVTYNGGLYRFTATHPAGDWNAAHVAAQDMTSPDATVDITGDGALRVTAADGSVLWRQGYNLSTESSAVLVCDNVGIFAFAAPFSDATAYAKDDRVTYDGKPYKFNAAHSAGAWVGTDADEEMFMMPTAAADKVGDFGVCIDNTANASDATEIGLSGLDSTFSVVVPKGQSLVDMLTFAGGELAVLYFTLTAFKVNNLPTWQVLKQVVENGGAAS